MRATGEGHGDWMYNVMRPGVRSYLNIRRGRHEDKTALQLARRHVSTRQGGGSTLRLQLSQAAGESVRDGVDAIRRVDDLHTLRQRGHKTA